MPTIAVAHHDAARARELARRLVACGRGTRLSLRAYVMSNLDMVETLDRPDAPEIDVLFLEASRAEALPLPPVTEGGEGVNSSFSMPRTSSSSTCCASSR